MSKPIFFGDGTEGSGEAMIQKYLDAIVADYNKWTNGNTPGRYSVSYEVLGKYIHVISDTYGQRSSHSWIVNHEGGKFPVGTILKSASWKSPAKNFARAYIDMPETFKRVRWTGW